MRNDAAAAGSECAGRVTRVGPGVSSVRPSEEVVAIAPGCFASHAYAGEALVFSKPPALSDEQAAGLLLATLTARYSLGAAGLQAQDWVLIHAAAGGVGLAAVHEAMRTGARVIATAGSAEKREYLRALGVEHVFDSRTPSFDQRVRRGDGRTWRGCGAQFPGGRVYSGGHTGARSEWAFSRNREGGFLRQRAGADHSRGCHLSTHRSRRHVGEGSPPSPAPAAANSG